MKGLFILMGSGLLATSLAVAQDMPANSSEGTNANPANQTTQSYQTSKGVIRGCLSGSAGNYTITDQNGMQYNVNGPENQLQASVGHEVEVTTRQDQASATSTEGDRAASTTTNSVQVSNLRDIASTCTPGHPNSASPMENENGASPKGTPDAAEPPRSEPQTMAMLQQQDSGVGTNSPQQQATPPVTSQTPAAPGQSTNSAQQAPAANGTSASTTTTTTTQQQSTAPSNSTGMTGSQVNQNAQSARQGEMNTNPNAATGTNAASPSATTNPNAAASSATQPNAASQDDQNKPLYERQATDIPWANHAGQNSGNAGSTGISTPPPQ